MALAAVTFRKVHCDLQIYGEENDMIVSRVVFDFEIPELRFKFENLYASIKQTTGSSFDDSPLEVGLPYGYFGSWNVQAFQNEADKYYRELIGPEGRLIQFDKGLKGIRVIFCTVDLDKVVTFDVDLDSTLGWK